MTKKDSPKRFTAPWSSSGWYGEAKEAERDPEMYAIIRRAGRGQIDPLGFRADSPALAVTPSTHNPYLALPLVAILAAVGTFLFGRLQGSAPVWGVITGLFFGLAALVILAMNVRRIPAWHRARRDVRNHISEHGGVFPRELRWFT